LECDYKYYTKATFICETKNNACYAFVSLGCPYPEKPPVIKLQALVQLAVQDIEVTSAISYNPQFTPSQFAKYVKEAIRRYQPTVPLYHSFPYDGWGNTLTSNNNLILSI